MCCVLYAEVQPSSMSKKTLKQIDQSKDIVSVIIKLMYGDQLEKDETTSLTIPLLLKQNILVSFH